MKNVIISMTLLAVAFGYSQKKKNGTVYKEHPAIETVNAMQEAWIAGDDAKVATFLADDFRSYYGSSINKNSKGRDKESFLGLVKNFSKDYAYVSQKPTNGAYPDAIEYKESGVWVQTWDHMKGVHNKTGVKIDMPFHRLYKLNDEGKIAMIINYYQNRIFWEVGRSYNDRKNGVIYNNHDNINSVRRMMAAFENADFEKAYSYFTEDCRFNGLELPDGETMSLEQVKERNEKMWDTYEFNSIDVVGYPDYLEYDLRDGKVVQSWWKFRMTRKSDGKKFVIPGLYIHDFNDEGKIVNSSAYISTKALDAK
ncbi:MAG: nuclear transport factor 2 family protein [Maribacter sp.]|nr:nuclear transport factor 2 family protein [Maribacter sp.]